VIRGWQSRSRCALAVLLAAACGPSAEPVERLSQAIIGGATDSSDVAVVAVQQPSTGTLCSGVLVAPTVVLTAAHCVFGVPASDLQVLTGPDTNAPQQTLAVQGAAAYPTYDSASGLAGGVDLGVVYLTTPSSIPPMPVRTDVTDAELTGASVTLIGYGLSSTTDPTTAGLRRSVVAPVDTVCSRIITVGDADANECEGDSGGAVLLGGQLVALISSGMLDCTAPANEMRLSAHTLWLAAVLQGKMACPGCVQPDPSCNAAIEGGGESPTADGGTADAEVEASASAGPSAGGSSCNVAGRERGRVFEAGLAIVLAACMSRRRAVTARAAASPRR
jgi:hypothetical protein